MVMQRKRVVTALLLLVLAFTIMACSPPAEEKVDLTTALPPWSCTPPLLQITKIILEEDLGYKVDVVEVDLPIVWARLASGEIDIFVDCWLPNQEPMVEEYGSRTEIVGVSYTGGLQGWAVPTYIEGVNSISDLYEEEIRDMFDFDNDGLGDLISIEAGAESTIINNEKITAYLLPYEQIEGSEQAMCTALENAYGKREPILIFTWTPHWMWAKYELKFLEDPDPYWPRSGRPGWTGWPVATVNTVVTGDLRERAPEAVEFLARFEIPLEDVNQAIYEIEIEGKDPAEWAREWIQQHRDIVDGWLVGLSQ